jgi:hypothetical protein
LRAEWVAEAKADLMRSNIFQDCRVMHARSKSECRDFDSRRCKMTSDVDSSR